MIEVIRTLADAMEYGRQYHDMVHGDFMTLANQERAIVILYKSHAEKDMRLDSQRETIKNLEAELAKLKKKAAKKVSP